MKAFTSLATSCARTSDFTSRLPCRMPSTAPQTLAPLVVAATDGLTLAYLNTGDLDVVHRIAEACVAMLLTHVEAA